MAVFFFLFGTEAGAVLPAFGASYFRGNGMGSGSSTNRSPGISGMGFSEKAILIALRQPRSFHISALVKVALTVV